jgi:hypothetical protein
MRVIVGLCALCRNARVIENRRGSQFWLCELSRVDRHFPRYPRLPVLSCAGHAPGTPQQGDETHTGGSID